MLATTLLGKGFSDGNPFTLDIAVTLSSELAREFFAESDLGIGAGLGHFTTEGGYLCPNAKVVQIDTNPHGLWRGLRTADLPIRADARATAGGARPRPGETIAARERYALLAARDSPHRNGC